MSPTFTFKGDEYFAGLRKAGLTITAEQEATARRIIDEENTGGDIYTMFINAIVSAFRAVNIFFGGDSKEPITDRLSAAMENGQQRGDMHTAAEVAHRIRNKLLSNGIPADLAAAMTGDTSTQHEIQGNLYRVFSDQRNISDKNRKDEAAYQKSQEPQLANLPTASRFAVANNPTVLAQNVPMATNSTRALTGYTPAA